MVDRDSPTPPYEQVANYLRGRIDAGEIASGTRLPSINQLAAEFGIGRSTAVRVFDVLAGQGYAETRQGWGTFAKRPAQPGG